MSEREVLYGVALFFIGFFVIWYIITSLEKYEKPKTKREQEQNSDRDSRGENSSYQRSSQNDRRSDAPREETKSARSWRDVLGVGIGADFPQVQSAYKALIVRYHPDRVADMAVELQEIATERTKELNSAYQEAKVFFGIQ